MKPLIIIDDFSNGILADPTIIPATGGGGQMFYGLNKLPR